MHGVLVALLAELEREEGVLAPRHVLLHVDLALVLGEVGEPLPPHGPEVDLRPRREVDVPELGVAGGLGVAVEVVARPAEEVAAGEALEGPAAGEVVADGDLELGRLVALVLECGEN